MKRPILFALILALSLPIIAVPALADPAGASSPAPSASVYTVPTVTIYGRPNRPQVLVVVRPPTAAAMASLAHESLRASLLAQSEPRPLR